MSPVVRLKHVHRFRDRHGRVRYYLRLPGCKAIPLPGEPGSPAFLAAYNRALEEAAPRYMEQRPALGSLDALAVSWYTSAAFLSLRPSTQAAYRRIVEELRSGYGTRPVRLMEPRHVEAIMREKAAAGAVTAANHRLRILRLLMQHALSLGWIERDPTERVARLSYRTEGFRTWSDADIAAYEAYWPSGTRERLALALLLYTGQRRSDVVRMGRQHLRDVTLDGAAVRVLEIAQAKTGRRVAIPLHPALEAELAQVPPDQLTFLMTREGAAFSPRGFYNWFRERCLQAGLPPGLSPHGLRKAAGRRLAEAGASAHQIMAILGVTLAVAETYTRAADQARLAVGAMRRLRDG